MPAPDDVRTRPTSPLLALLSLSDLGREGIANRGSFRFADHLYHAGPSGRGAVGHALDALLLKLPAARAFRRRYVHARDTMAAAVRACPAGSPIRVLTVPCGIPRDVMDMGDVIARESPALLDRVEYVGMDIDPEALRVAAAFASGRRLVRTTFHRGDALDRRQYPAGRFHVASSTGLGEFLDDEQLGRLYGNVFDMLEKGGTFYTSATAPEPLSALLLRAIDLPTTYRTREQLGETLERFPWRRVQYAVDPTGLQTFATAVK